MKSFDLIHIGFSAGWSLLGISLLLLFVIAILERFEVSVMKWRHLMTNYVVALAVFCLLWTILGFLYVGLAVSCSCHPFSFYIFVMPVVLGIVTGYQVRKRRSRTA